MIVWLRFPLLQGRTFDIKFPECHKAAAIENSKLYTAFRKYYTSTDWKP